VSRWLCSFCIRLPGRQHVKLGPFLVRSRGDVDVVFADPKVAKSVQATEGAVPQLRRIFSSVGIMPAPQSPEKENIEGDFMCPSCA